MSKNSTSSLSKNLLPIIKGSYRHGYPLSKVAWFKVGGPAELMFIPKDKEDLINFLKNTIINKFNLFVIGACSNLLIRDGGLDGVVIKLGKDFKSIKNKEDYIFVGAGALDIVVSKFAASRGIGGLEFLSGIPGTIGGSIFMNAGAYGKEISDILISIEAVDRSGNIHNIESKDIKFSYRSSKIKKNLILLSACLKGYKEDKLEIEKKIREIKKLRSETQPVRKKTGGSTFKNPEDSNYKAWELIELSGCRGMEKGGAKISDLHCNFLVNSGTASAFELEELGNDIKNKVLYSTGVTLDWEIERVGNVLEVSS
ncbi:MAG: UDP-N-acetylenolpyruvoylglucosamine reductase [Rhodospirillaceae bacterium]|nr:UDP-N-acetylenolpyruvoylglucosamine reductase [Rhodospirillaceae bacterium]